MNGTRRILMISDHSDPLAELGGEEAGGQNVYVDRLSSWLSEKGHEVFVLTRQNSPKKKLREKSPSGYTVIRTPLGPEGFMPKEEFPTYLPDFIKAAIELTDEIDFDVIHSHYWLSGLCAVGVKKQKHIPVVHTFHSLGKVKHSHLKGIDPEQIKKRERGEQTIVRNVDCLLAESSEERRNLLHLHKANPDKITVIPAGVDTQVFTPGNQQEARKKLGIQHKHVLLYVGRFVAQKGLPTLLQAYALVRNTLSEKEKKDTILVLAGGNLLEKTEKQSRMQKRIQELVKSLDLHDAVRFEGQIANQELSTYYQAADMCIVPSRYEPFGIVPLEAMSCGTPVIASFVGGMKSTVRNLYTGLHARPNKSADFAHKIGILLKNESLRKEFGRQAREDMEKEYDWESVCDRILTCYNATIARD